MDQSCQPTVKDVDDEDEVIMEMQQTPAPTQEPASNEDELSTFIL